MINAMIRLQRGDEEIIPQRTIAEQKTEPEAKTREEKTVEEFIEAQACYENDLSRQARQAVQQHAHQ